MKLEGLESFLTIAQNKSISKAALCLHISQPALSARIRRLEEGLGFPLLKRSWDGVRLTAQGQYFLPYAIQLIRELSDASTVLTDFGNAEQNTSLKNITGNNEDLLIGINRWLAPVFTKAIISELSAKFPGIGYKFVTRPTDTLKDLVQYGGVHIGIYYQNGKETTGYSELLIEDEMVLVCSSDDTIIIQGDTNKLRTLNKPYLLFDNPVLANNRVILDDIMGKLDINRFQIIDDINIMESYISSNKGYSILPRSATYNLINPESSLINILPLGTQFPTMEIQMAYNETSPFIEPIKTICNRLSLLCMTEYKKTESY